MILAAKLSEKLSIQKLEVSGTTYGGIIETWCDYKTVYASITTQRGNTRFADGNQYFDGISFYLRFISLDRKGYRILYNGNTYQINNISPIQRNKALVIDCTSVE